MEITAYAWIKPNPLTHRGLGKPSDFGGRILPCIEINPEGDALVYREGVGLAMIEPSDLFKWFRCRVEGGYVLPPGGDMGQRHANIVRAIIVSGGDSKIFNAAVIAMSLQKGEYYTGILK